MEAKEPEPPRRENTIAIAGFDGEATQIIEADEIRFCAPTKKCIQFWAAIVTAFVAIGVGIALMLIDGTDSKYFATGSTLLGFGIGFLIPG